MATLAAVQLEDLPVVVKFILHSVSASDAYEVRVHIIEHLKHITMYLCSGCHSTYYEVKKCGVCYPCVQVVCNLRKKLELEQCILPPVLQASQSRMKSKGSVA